MEPRTYILAGLLLLVIVGLVYLLAALVSYRKALRRQGSASPVPAQSGEPTYLGPDADRLDDVFEVVRPSEVVPEAAATAPTPSPVTSRSEQAAARRHFREDEIPVVHAGAAHAGPGPSGGREPEPELAPASEPELASEPEPVLAPEPEPVLAPEPEPVAEPASASQYSLADELEQLVAAAAAAPPLLTPDEHHKYVSPVPAAEPGSAEAAPEEPSVPVVPRPSVGQVLSAPGPEAAVPTGEADAQAVGPGSSDAPVYTLVSPVELHFTEGGGRLGVRVGTRTHAEFQRLANILLGDLKASRDR